MSEAETELRQRRNLDSQEIEEPIIQDRVSSFQIQVELFNKYNSKLCFRMMMRHWMWTRTQPEKA